MSTSLFLFVSLRSEIGFPFSFTVIRPVCVGEFPVVKLISAMWRSPSVSPNKDFSDFLSQNP